MWNLLEEDAKYGCRGGCPINHKKGRKSIPIRGIEFKYLFGSLELFSMEDLLEL